MRKNKKVKKQKSMLSSNKKKSNRENSTNVDVFKSGFDNASKTVINYLPEDYAEPFRNPIFFEPTEDFKIQTLVNRGKYCEAYSASTGFFPFINYCKENNIPVQTTSKGRIVVIMKFLKKVIQRKFLREHLILKHLACSRSMFEKLEFDISNTSSEISNTKTTEFQELAEDFVLNTQSQKTFKSIDRPTEENIVSDRNDRKYIIPLLGVVTRQEESMLDPCFVFPFIPTVNNDIKIFRNKFKNQGLSKEVLKGYIFRLCKAIRACHRAGIMHRDVKPHNIVFCEKKDIFYLLDFGLAEFYYPGKTYTTKVASKHYKAPELLLNYGNYDYGVDVWGIGVVMAGLILGIEPLFKESTDEKMVYKIIQVLGSKDIRIFIEKNSLEFYMGFNTADKKKWESIDKNARYYLDNDAIDVINKMLTVDPDFRPDIDQIIKMKWFDSVRNKY